MEWDNITLEDYIELFNLRFDGLSPTEYNLERLLILTGEDYENKSVDEFDAKVKELDFLKIVPAGDIKVNTKKIKFGSFIDIATYRNQGLPITNAHKIYASTLEGDRTQLANDALEMKAADIIHALNDIIVWQDDIVEKYGVIFDDPDDEDLTEEDLEEAEEIINPASKWGFLPLLHKLAKGDVTKADEITEMNTGLVLNWLAMEIDLKIGSKEI